MGASEIRSTVNKLTESLLLVQKVLKQHTDAELEKLLQGEHIQQEPDTSNEQTPDTESPQASEPDTNTRENAPTIDDVRSVLLTKTREGYRDEVKAILFSHGAERLPDIDPSEYAAIIKEAEELQ